jgi:predicted CopG family antitoxin
MQIHEHYRVASKRIVVTADVYDMIRRQKLAGESFNDLLRRLAERRGKLRPHFGALADEPPEFFETMERVIATVERSGESGNLRSRRTDHFR